MPNGDSTYKQTDADATSVAAAGQLVVIYLSAASINLASTDPTSVSERPFCS